MSSSTTYAPNLTSVAPTNSSSGTVTPMNTAATATAAKPAAAAPHKEDKKEDKADVVREKVAETVEQLGRRWKGLSRLKDQVLKHPLATILSSAAVLLAIGGSITVGVLESQRRRTFSYRFKKGLRNVRRQLTR